MVHLIVLFLFRQLNMSLVILLKL